MGQSEHIASVLEFIDKQLGPVLGDCTKCEKPVHENDDDYLVFCPSTELYRRVLPGTLAIDPDFLDLFHAHCARQVMRDRGAL